MKVWRVAHETMTYLDFPAGPYVNGMDTDVFYCMWNAHDCNTSHPSPNSDYKLSGIDEAERCGFDSLEALNKWFEGFHDVLHSAGYLVFVYDVPAEDVRVGRHGQAVFPANSAIEITRNGVAHD